MKGCWNQMPYEHRRWTSPRKPDFWQATMAEFGQTNDFSIQALTGIAATWKYWVWIPPLILVVLVDWWMLSARYSFLPDRRPSRLLGIIPGLKSIVECWHWSNFCDLLATLLEHQVPLPTAMNLAADATGNTRIHDHMKMIAEEMQSGRSISESLRQRVGIPAYLRWSLGAARNPAALVSSLRHGSELYRSRASFRADALRMWLPLATIVLVGGGAVLFYALSMALPLRTLFWQLNRDGMR